MASKFSVRELLSLFMFGRQKLLQLSGVQAGHLHQLLEVVIRIPQIAALPTSQIGNYILMAIQLRILVKVYEDVEIPSLVERSTALQLETQPEQSSEPHLLEVLKTESWREMDIRVAIEEGPTLCVDGVLAATCDREGAVHEAGYKMGWWLGRINARLVYGA